MMSLLKSKRSLIPVAAVLAGGTLITVSVSSGQSTSKIHASLAQILDRESGPVKAWVFFTDKGVSSAEEYEAAIAELQQTYNPRAIQRRQARRSSEGMFDARDLPVSATYVDAVRATGAELRVTSTWLNAVSIVADSAQIESIAGLPFVQRLQPVLRGRKIAPPVQPVDLNGDWQTRGWYGYAEDQLNQMSVIDVHNAGYTGAGVVVGVLDSGFERSHEAFNYPGHSLNVIAEWDFVDNDGDTSIESGDYWDQHTHGTMILGTLGAYYPNSFVGTAYDATFVLAKTEDVESEYPAEEDNYVAGLQFVESNGADMATSSLGYIDWYTQGDLDGLTAVTTIAVNTATDNGLICCTAAGNEYHDSNPNTSTLIAPSDAFDVITCGAVDGAGVIADFSSDGPTADGRVKPELLAWGVDTISVWPYDTNGYVYVSGTSASTPLVAGAIACLLQAHPEWTVNDVRNHTLYTADYYVANGTYEPTFVYGYGIIDAYAALNLSFIDCNENSVQDADDISGGASQDCNLNGVPDECDIASGASNDTDGDGVPDECQCLGDLDGDGGVGLSDLSKLLSNYGQSSGMTPTDGDLDGDGDVDLADLSMLLSLYGATCN